MFKRLCASAMRSMGPLSVPGTFDWLRVSMFERLRVRIRYANKVCNRHLVGTFVRLRVSTSNGLCAKSFIEHVPVQPQSPSGHCYRLH